MSLNRVLIMGRLGRDPELRRTQAGTAVASFSLAVDRDFKDKTTGETYRVTSNPEDKQAPRSSTLPLKYFTAERWALTT